MGDAHAREVEDVLSFFGTDVHTGLSDFEVSKVQDAAPTSCCWMIELVAPTAAAAVSEVVVVTCSPCCLQSRTRYGSNELPHDEGES